MCSKVNAALACVASAGPGARLGRSSLGVCSAARGGTLLCCRLPKVSHAVLQHLACLVALWRLLTQVSGMPQAVGQEAAARLLRASWGTFTDS